MIDGTVYTNMLFEPFDDFTESLSDPLSQMSPAAVVSIAA
jgi:hypothetical protein